MQNDCLAIARIFQVEDLANSAFFEEDRAIIACEGEATLTLRKESRQLLRVVKISAIYFIVLAILYLVQSLVCLYQLSADDFLDQFTKQYAIEVYEYSI